MRVALNPRLVPLALFALLAACAPAFAAKEEKDEPKPALYVKDGDKYREAKAEEIAKASGHEAHGKGGLDFTGIKRYDLGIYTLIVFGILMFVLSKYAWPHIKSGLEKREANILGALDQAKKDRAEAEARLTEARKQLADAAQQAAAIVAEARKDAEALRASEAEKAAKDAQATKERADRDAEAKVAALTKEAQQHVAELAALMASKAIRGQLSIQNQSALLDESIAELNANTNRA